MRSYSTQQLSDFLFSFLSGLQQLVKLCTDLSYSKEASEYATQLKRVEKQNLLKEQAVSVYRTFVPFYKIYSTGTVSFIQYI